MVVPIVDSVIRYLDGLTTQEKVELAAISANMELKFGLPTGILGGELSDGSVVVPRGLFTPGDGSQDSRFEGPLVEVFLDESKLDERLKHQKPIVEKALLAEQGVIVAPTGAGKTVIECLVVAKIQRRTLILTHTAEIVAQIKQAVHRLLGVTPGFVGSGIRDVRPITVGLIQSVRSDDPILKNIGLLLIDEAHHCSAPGYLRLLAACPAKYRIGLTATLRRTDEKEKVIAAALGKTIAEIHVKDLQNEGHLNKGFYRPIFTSVVGTYFDYVSQKCWYYRGSEKSGAPAKCPAPCTYPKDGELEACVYERGYYNWIYDKLGNDELRNERIVKEVFQASLTHPWTVLLTHRKKHANLLATKLCDLAQGPDVHLLHGDLSKKAQAKAVQAFRDEGGVLVSVSQKIGEGFDAPKTSCLVRAMPAGGKVAVRQQTGRIMRPQEKPALIIDFVDSNVARLKRMWMGRRSIYHAIGFQEEPKEKIQGDLF